MADQHPAPGAGQPSYIAPPQAGFVPPPPPPPPPPPRGPYPPAPVPSGPRGSIWLGLAIGLVSSVLIYGGLIAASTGTFPLASDVVSVLGLASLAWPVVLLVGGIVLAVIPRTTRTGAGLLISIGVAILVAGGLCVALLVGAGAGTVR